MHVRSREVAKFLSGIAFHEMLGHWWLGTWGRYLLPWDVGWFTFTREMNIFAMIAWPIVFAALVWYAWFKPRCAAGPVEPTVARS